MKILVTGGAGFIGSNICNTYLGNGDYVILYDNFSRNGGKENLKWLKKRFNNLEVYNADINDKEKVEEAASKADIIFHMAGQVAVTTSVKDPIGDFISNAAGTLNVLEAARKSNKDPIFVYPSTNKVYGGMEHLGIHIIDEMYKYKELEDGADESINLDFHSPYGCSKGTGDQYTRDYHRIYGLKTLIFRQSCIYGPRQFGISDQGWIAWFMVAGTLGKPITVYGDGMQVRDILYVDDLVNAYNMAIEKIEKTKGQIYNIGGGPSNLLSLRQLLNFLNEKGLQLNILNSGWRPGDQRVFFGNIKKAKQEFGWEPKVGVSQGLNKMYDWVQENKKVLGKNL